MKETVSFLIEDKLFLADVSLTDCDKFDVQSVPRCYPVSWDDSLHPFDSINQLVNANPGNLIVIDEIVLKHYGELLQSEPGRLFVVKATEMGKTLGTITELLDFLQAHAFTKSETLIVVGGGITQDIAGFVGACYKRGIPWVYFPTTLLSMSDSCIGGKVSLNYNGSKNQVALFSSPNAVVIHPGFLKTLSPDAIQSGLGEILKMCIIAGPSAISLYCDCVMKGNLKEPDDYKKLIMTALRIKRAVVEEDEFETHHRKSLNYGHTIGHAIESLSNYAIPHGQAVVFGMMIVNELSYKMHLLSKPEKQTLNQLCGELVSDERWQRVKNMDMKSILTFLQKDKKVENDDIQFVLLKTAGELVFTKMNLNQALIDQLTECLQALFLVL